MNKLSSSKCCVVCTRLGCPLMLELKALLSVLCSGCKAVNRFHVWTKFKHVGCLVQVACLLQAPQTQQPPTEPPPPPPLQQQQQQQQQRVEALPPLLCALQDQGLLGQQSQRHFGPPEEWDGRLINVPVLTAILGTPHMVMLLLGFR